MLFGNGNWAIVGLKKESKDNFEKTLKDPIKLFNLSALAASVSTRFTSKTFCGLNPFAKPRMDEAINKPEQLEDINDYVTIPDPELKANSLFDPTLYTEGFGATGESFLVNENSAGNVYGFWFVTYGFDDVSDIASKREQVSYDRLTKPYKLTVKEDKKMVEVTVQSVTVPTRVQIPFIVDFQSERVYIASTSKEEILFVRGLLQSMGLETHDLNWNFGKNDWPSIFLTKIYAETRYSEAFNKRAEDRKLFSKEMIEKLDDKMMERIVSTYFSMTELESGDWVGMKTPAQVKLMNTVDPISSSSATTVTTLRNFADADKFQVIAASLVFQELNVRMGKNGIEYPFRTDKFSLTLNENINLLEAGAAMLRSFNLPNFKKHMKQHDGSEIKNYWYQWLVQMRGAIVDFSAGVIMTLDISSPDHGLREPRYSVEEISTEGL